MRDEVGVDASAAAADLDFWSFALRSRVEDEEGLFSREGVEVEEAGFSSRALRSRSGFALLLSLSDLALLSRSGFALLLSLCASGLFSLCWLPRREEEAEPPDSSA